MTWYHGNHLRLQGPLARTACEAGLRGPLVGTACKDRCTVVDFGSKPCLFMKFLEFKYRGLNIHFEPVQIQWT